MLAGVPASESIVPLLKGVVVPGSTFPFRLPSCHSGPLYAPAPESRLIVMPPVREDKGSLLTDYQ